MAEHRILYAQNVDGEFRWWCSRCLTLPSKNYPNRELAEKAARAHERRARQAKP